MASVLKPGFILLMTTLLVSCVAHVHDSDWIEDVPARSYFQKHWQSDSANQQLQNEDEYLVWVQRFYQGFKLAPGWLELTKQIENGIPAKERKRVHRILTELGGKICAEWAKNNKVRKINSRSAAIWRDAVRESLAQDDLYPFLERLERDINNMLAGKLSNDQIYFERYYVDQFDF